MVGGVCWLASSLHLLLFLVAILAINPHCLKTPRRASDISMPRALGLRFQFIKWLIVILLLLVQTHDALLFGSSTRPKRPRLENGMSMTNSNKDVNDKQELSVTQAVQNRYACKAFQRFDGAPPDTSEASPPDPHIVQKAWDCLDLARLSPSSFNTQPYRVILVHSAAQKLALSKVCLGPNARRVLDADCTAVFLADKQVLKTVFAKNRKPNGPPRNYVNLFYITMFSSGYPLPRVIAATIGFWVRTVTSWLDLLTRKLFRYPLPTLTSSETWATKQTSLVAMTYMLACAERGIATIPMEGLNAAGMRRALGIPRRYAIPLIVATGRAAKPKRERSGGERRYPVEDVIFGDRWNEPLTLDGATA